MKWKYQRIGDVCTVERGGSPRPIDDYITKSSNGIKWIKIGDTTDSMYITHTEQKIKPEGMKKSRFVHAGDFLLSNSMSFGRPYILAIDGCIHDGWLVLHDDENRFDKRFLYYYLSAPITYQKFEHMAVGGVVNNLNSKMVRNLEVPIPAKSEQEEIADKLDQITRIISNRQHVLTLLDELVKSRFVEMFGDPVTNPFGFQKILLKDVAEIKIGPFGSLLHQDDYVEGQHALVNPSHIRGDTIVPDNKLTVSEERYRELEAYHLQKYDIVLGRRGEMGRAAVVQENGLLCGTGSLLIRVKEKINPYFLQKIITYPTFKKYIESKSVGTTMQNLNAKMVSNLEIPIYPLELQNQFSTFVHQVEATKTTVRAQLAALTTLRAKMMQEFFG